MRNRFARESHSSRSVPHRIQVPVLILQGEADTLTPPNMCRALGKMENIRIEYFEGATHGFDEPGVDEILNGSIIKHDPAAEAAAVTFVKSFLDEVGR
jgi:dienelactone hydrolase